jgi:hypothetical protein
MSVAHCVLALLAGLLAACVGLPPPPPSGAATDATQNTGQVSGGSQGSSGSMTTGEGTSSTGPLGVDGSSTSSSPFGSSTGVLDTGGSSSESTTGGVSSVGCADGFREALFDEVLYPDVAACAGGFWVPGVGNDTPLCDRQGGDDGPLPDGMGCAIDDLCADGWHLCASRQDVAAAGLAVCDGIVWDGQFFVTAQSGEAANTCNDTGTNEVFGCGDIGSSSISNCAPLNRSTGNLCVNLSGAWSCSEDAYDEVSHIVKPGSDAGGALCCRDGGLTS